MNREKAEERTGVRDRGFEIGKRRHIIDRRLVFFFFFFLSFHWTRKLFRESLASTRSISRSRPAWDFVNAR